MIKRSAPYAAVIALATLLSALALATAKEKEKAKPAEIDITGRYTCKGRAGANREYVGRTFISKKKDTYQLAWTVGNELYFGEGIREGNVLSVCWLLGQTQAAGITVFHIEEGPKLLGTWTQLGGNGNLLPEDLTFVERLKDRKKRVPGASDSGPTVEIRLEGHAKPQAVRSS